MWELAGVPPNQSGKILSSHVGLSFVSARPASLFDSAATENHYGAMLSALKVGSHRW